MKLSRNNLILIGVLVLQIALTVMLFLPRTSANEQPAMSGPLLKDFKSDTVSQITIHDNSNNEIVLSKDASGKWVLPKMDNYPVTASQVSTLLTKIQALQTNRLIARNKSNHNRLHVGDTTYERLVELKESGDKVDRLYVGSSAGTDATHMRLNDQDEVYLTSGLGSFDVSATASSWVNTTYFSAAQDKITSFRIDNAQGSFVFKKVNNAWVLDGTKANETMNTDEVTKLVNQLASVTLTTPVGKTAQDKFQMNKPTATITLATHDEVSVQPTAQPTALSVLPNNQATATPLPPVTKPVDATYTLIVGAKLENGDYAFKSSESPYYVQISASAAEMFTNLKRTDMVTAGPSTIQEF